MDGCFALSKSIGLKDEDILNKERIQDITVKLFKDREKYINRLNELNQSEADTSARKDIVSMLYSVSL